MRLRWSRSSTKHRISRRRSGYVVRHCGLILRVPGSDPAEDRLLFLGDDEEGVPLEVMAVELEADELYVIHAMPLREKYRSPYEEAKKWRS